MVVVAVQVVITLLEKAVFQTNMRSKIQSKKNFSSVCLSALSALFACAAPVAHSEITALTVSSTTPIGTYKSVAYVRLEGEAVGELDPNEKIPDIEKAARLKNGRIQYKTRFVLITPKDPKKSNGGLLIDVPNRGLPISHAFYNSPRARPLPIGSLDSGVGFLEEQGFMVAAVQWELAQGIEPPTFIDEKGATRYIEAVGFAAVRDMALYLRDSTSKQNPLAGAVKRTYAVGYSQTSRFLKSYLLHGFNTVGGKQVINGFHLVGGAAGQLPLMASGTGPASVASSTPGPTVPEHRGVHEEPFSYDELLGKLSARKEPLPKIFVTHYNIDYMGGRASLTRTGADGIKERPMPSSMRMYDLAGAAHLNVREQDKDCELPHGQLDWSAPLRAQLFTLNQWVARNIAPPNTTLMSLRQPRENEGVFRAPNYLPNAVVLVPVTDADDNPVGGVRLPDVSVPLGTHGRPNAPLTKSVCRLAGSYKPFTVTAKDRAATTDTRLSLQERYQGGLNEYVMRVREAADQLVVQRHLLPDDAAVIMNAAADEKLFTPTPTLPIFRSKGNMYNCKLDALTGKWQCLDGK